VHHPLRTTSHTIGHMAMLEYIGHSTVLIELDGVRILTDPLLRMRVGHLRRAVPLDESPPQPDVVLISHGHYDHLDLQSLRMLPRSARVIAPRGLGARIQGFDTVEVEAGEELEVAPSLVIRATPAEHEGGRAPRRTGPAVGYAVLGSKRVFFAGDTDLFDAMDGLVSELDVALIPIWGWGATLGRGKHLDPERAAEAARRLGPRLAVPIHWGTYRPLHRSALAPFLLEPADAFVRAVATVAPDVEARVLRPGERLDL
jgi:L-ascorbate metabolism protein UlaG (beta-lactamase superfamily)